MAIKGRRVSTAKREQLVRRLARHLAVEAKQIGATAGEVLKVIKEELAEFQDADVTEMPARVSFRK